MEDDDGIRQSEAVPVTGQKCPSCGGALETNGVYNPDTNTIYVWCKDYFTCGWGNSDPLTEA